MKEFSILDMVSGNVPSGSEPMLSSESTVQLPPMEAVSLEDKKSQGRVGWLAAGGLALVMGVVGAGEKLGLIEKGTMGKGFNTAVDFLGTITVKQQMNGLYAEGRGDNFEKDVDLVFHHRVGTLMSDWNDYFSDYPFWADTDVDAWPPTEKKQFDGLEPRHKAQILWVIAARKKVAELKNSRQILIDDAVGYLEKNPPRNWNGSTSESYARDALKTVADIKLPEGPASFGGARKTQVLTADSNLAK